MKPFGQYEEPIPVPGYSDERAAQDLAAIVKTWPLTSRSISIEVKDVQIEVIAVMMGIPLVDLSIEWEPHLVRGLE